MKAVEIFFTVFNIILGIVNLTMHMTNRKVLAALEEMVIQMREDPESGR